MSILRPIPKLGMPKGQWAPALVSWLEDFARQFSTPASLVDKLKPLNLEGSGTPEGAVVAPKGSTFNRRDGGAATSFYVKESGAGNTGWVGK